MNLLILGLDSLIACMAIGAIVGGRSCLPLAALFGVADGVAFLIGSAAGWQLSSSVSDVVETGMLVGLGLYLVVVARLMRRVAPLADILRVMEWMGHADVQTTRGYLVVGQFERRGRVGPCCCSRSLSRAASWRARSTRRSFSGVGSRMNSACASLSFRSATSRRDSFVSIAAIHRRGRPT